MGPRFAGKPMPLGHEWAGEVIEVGAYVTRFKVGERVAYNSNNSPADMGRGGECGGFSNYVVLRDVDNHARSLCRLPDNVSYDHAALVEPVRRGHPRGEPRQSPAGGNHCPVRAGPIGLGIIMTLAGRRFDDVVVFDLSPLRRELAMKVGARSSLQSPGEFPRAGAGGTARPRCHLGCAPSQDRHLHRGQWCSRACLHRNICRFCNKGSRIITVAVHRQPLTLDGTKIMAVARPDRLTGLPDHSRGNDENRQRGNRPRKHDQPPLPLRAIQGSFSSGRQCGPGCQSCPAVQLTSPGNNLHDHNDIR